MTNDCFPMESQHIKGKRREARRNLFNPLIFSIQGDNKKTVRVPLCKVEQKRVCSYNKSFPEKNNNQKTTLISNQIELLNFILSRGIEGVE